jgi:hypothetical protein
MKRVKHLTPENARRFHSYLKVNAKGRENRVPGKVVLIDLSLPWATERQKKLGNGSCILARDLAHLCNEMGLLVCASRTVKGYWIPTDREDAITGIESNIVSLETQQRNIDTYLALVDKQFPA